MLPECQTRALVYVRSIVVIRGSPSCAMQRISSCLRAAVFKHYHLHIIQTLPVSRFYRDLVLMEVINFAASHLAS